MTKAYVYDIYLATSGSEDEYLTSVAIEAGYIDGGSFEDVAAADNSNYDSDPTGNIAIIPDVGGKVIKFKYKGKY